MCSERGKFGPLGGSQQGRHGDGAHSGAFFLRARALVLARVLGWMDWRQRVLAEKKTSRYGAKLTTNYSATLGLITAVNIIIVSSYIQL